MVPKDVQYIILDDTKQRGTIKFLCYDYLNPARKRRMFITRSKHLQELTFKLIQAFSC